MDPIRKQDIIIKAWTNFLFNLLRAKLLNNDEEYSRLIHHINKAKESEDIKSIVESSLQQILTDNKDDNEKIKENIAFLGEMIASLYPKSIFQMLGLNPHLRA